MQLLEDAESVDVASEVFVVFSLSSICAEDFFFSDVSTIDTPAVVTSILAWFPVLLLLILSILSLLRLPSLNVWPKYGCAEERATDAKASSPFSSSVGGAPDIENPRE